MCVFLQLSFECLIFCSANTLDIEYNNDLVLSDFFAIIKT